MSRYGNWIINSNRTPKGVRIVEKHKPNSQVKNDELDFKVDLENNISVGANSIEGYRYRGQNL